MSHVKQTAKCVDYTEIFLVLPCLASSTNYIPFNRSILTVNLVATVNK